MPATRPSSVPMLHAPTIPVCGYMLETQHRLNPVDTAVRFRVVTRKL
jgi:hypothetical protein